MAFTLRNKDQLKVDYSKSERRLFEFIPQDGSKVTIDDLAMRYYADLGPPPFNGRIIINGTVNLLSRKASANGEPFVIVRSPRSGPHSTSVWIETRASKRKRA